ncbi:hypothetical protein [Agrococcus jejuensis]|uniref:Uncharacterized protein n=1 Tax=Agrococcus jejuensis TaxID=399736 RepID=A0A1G8GBL1_9MICO|nr:hypothetical protein [Agrococcus jejuensis]SDH91726.1 hypothetical protein SAMN04489720_2846 [Agrococcus jejuensis]
MRIVCLVLGVLAMAISGVFVLMAGFGVRGVLDVSVEADGARHIEMAGIFALFGIAWMVASVAFRPAPAVTVAPDASAPPAAAPPR